MLSLPIIITIILCFTQKNCDSVNNRKLPLANNEFGLKLQKTLSSNENVIISPLSVFMALGMLYKGARTATAQEMRDTLGYNAIDINDDSIHQEFGELLKLLSSSQDDYVLEIANAMVCQGNSTVLDDFKDTLLKYYNALYKETNFVNANTHAVQEINSWVSEKTQGKITTLLQELSPDTRLVLLNAIYFKGLWEKPFNTDFTRKDIFYNKGREPIEVPMMHQVQKVLYTRNARKNLHAISLPYKGSHLSMVIILPLQRDGLRNVESSLTARDIDEIISDLRGFKVSVHLPKFKLENSMKLKDNLKALGMEHAFSESADLSGINGGSDLYVYEVVHKAIIEVNEEGTEAAGSTAVIVNTRVSPIPFACYHPFMFIIRDHRTGMNLFMGRVNQL